MKWKFLALSLITFSSFCSFSAADPSTDSSTPGPTTSSEFLNHRSTILKNIITGVRSHHKDQIKTQSNTSKSSKSIVLKLKTGPSSNQSLVPNTTPNTNVPAGSVSPSEPADLSIPKTNSQLLAARKAFEKRDYNSALNLYQNALSKHGHHSNQDFSFLAPPTPSLAQKVVSLFKTKQHLDQPQTNPDSKNIVDGYIYLQIGKAHTKLNHMSDAEKAFGQGVTAAGDNPTGNTCLFEKGMCQMHRLDYQNAYQSLKEYVKRNADKDPEDLDQNRMKRAVYMATMCAWKLNKSGTEFEADMPGAKDLAKKAFAMIASMDKRIYFKKKN